MTILKDFIPLFEIKCDPDKFYRLVAEKNINQNCEAGYKKCSEYFYIGDNELGCYMCIDRKLYEARKQVINCTRDVFEDYVDEMMGGRGTKTYTGEQLEEVCKLFKGFPEFKKSLESNEYKKTVKRFKEKIIYKQLVGN